MGMKLFSVIDRFYFSIIENIFVLVSFSCAHANNRKGQNFGFFGSPDLIPFSVLRFLFSDKQKGREVTFIYNLVGLSERIDPYKSFLFLFS